MKSQDTLRSCSQPERFGACLGLLLVTALPTLVHSNEVPETSKQDWCAFLQNDPGLLYESEENRWLQKVELGGRFHYQIAHIDGEDVNDRSFTDNYDEYRRARLGVEVDFLRFLSAEVEINLVEDRRFRDSPPQDLDWGYQDFADLVIEVDFDRAFEPEMFDKLELEYGRMRLGVGEESHQSSREILTIERSSLSEKVGPSGRPTGGLLKFGREDWEVSGGVFSRDVESRGWASWEDGRFYYLSLEWEPGDFRFVYDHVLNGSRRPTQTEDLSLEYAWAGAFSAVYTAERWGVMLTAASGDNGGADEGNPRVRRQGDFWGVVAMPWVWIVEDRLQLVLSYEHMEAEEDEGIELETRYVEGRHDSWIDVEGGRGDRSDVIYCGLNYYLCGDRAKIMGGLSHTELETRSGKLSALTSMLAFRMYF